MPKYSSTASTMAAGQTNFGELNLADALASAVITGNDGVDDGVSFMDWLQFPHGFGGFRAVLLRD